MFRRQYIPSLDDIQNIGLIKLAKNLKEDSPKQTLTKIVDWQERNIPYWEDRANMFILLIVFLILAVSMLPLHQTVKSVIIVVLAILGIFDLMFSLIYMLLLIAFIILVLTLLFTTNFTVGSSVLPIGQLIMLSIFFGGIISLLFYLLMKYRSLKAIRPGFKLGDTFKLSLPIEKILGYRLAICRDYAKITAGLLFHIYPDKQILFIETQGHVATAISIAGKYYVLDQKLPVLTLDQWMAFWKIRLNRRCLSVTILEMTVTDRKVCAKKVKSEKLDTTEIPNIDTKDLHKKLVKNLNVQDITTKQEPDLEIPLMNFAVRYSKDEIVEHAILAFLKNKLEKEFCSDLTKLAKIDLVQNQNDLILRIFTK